MKLEETELTNKALGSILYGLGYDQRNVTTEMVAIAHQAFRDGFKFGSVDIHDVVMKSASEILRETEKPSPNIKVVNRTAKFIWDMVVLGYDNNKGRKNETP